MTRKNHHLFNLPLANWAEQCFQSSPGLTHVSSQLPCSQRKADVGWPELVWPVSIPCSPHPFQRGPGLILMLKAQVQEGEQKQDHSVAQAGMEEKLVQNSGSGTTWAERTPLFETISAPAGSALMGL